MTKACYKSGVSNMVLMDIMPHTNILPGACQGLLDSGWGYVGLSPASLLTGHWKCCWKCRCLRVLLLWQLPLQHKDLHYVIGGKPWHPFCGCTHHAISVQKCLPCRGALPSMIFLKKIRWLHYSFLPPPH